MIRGDYQAIRKKKIAGVTEIDFCNLVQGGAKLLRDRLNTAKGKARSNTKPKLCLPLGSNIAHQVLKYFC